MGNNNKTNKFTKSTINDVESITTGWSHTFFLKSIIFKEFLIICYFNNFVKRMENFLVVVGEILGALVLGSLTITLS